MSISYLPPFGLLRNAVKTSHDDDAVTISKELFSMLLATLANAAGFDATWYRDEYPDVASAISDGDVTSELQHFVEFGYWEGRAHRVMPVDDNWYRQNYPDIDQALRESDDMSAQDHYNAFGYFEGRANNAMTEAEAQQWAEAVERSSTLVVGGRDAELDQ